MTDGTGTPSAAAVVGESERPAAALVDSGTGPAVLLLHGWGASKELMAPIIQRLPGYRAIAPDLPGFGATAPPPVAWGPDEYAAWVIALMDRLGVDRAHVVGHSNGGRIAIALAAERPDRVGRLVLTDSAGIRPRHGPAYQWRVRTFKSLRRLSQAGWVPGAVRAWARVRAEARGSTDYRTAAGTVRASMVRLVNADLRPQLSQLTPPTLLIWGERDEDTPLRDARTMEGLIPDSGLVVLEGGGHFAYAEQPDRFARIVDVFLRGDAP